MATTFYAVLVKFDFLLPRGIFPQYFTAVFHPSGSLTSNQNIFNRLDMLAMSLSFSLLRCESYAIYMRSICFQYIPCMVHIIYNSELTLFYYTMWCIWPYIYIYTHDVIYNKHPSLSISHFCTSGLHLPYLTVHCHNNKQCLHISNCYKVSSKLH